MDPLSITASAIAILQVTTQITTTARGFYKDARNAPREIRELLEELKSFSAVLESLKTINEKSKEASVNNVGIARAGGSSLCASDRLPAISNMLRPDAPLSTCHSEMLQFQKKLTKNGSKIKKALKWPFQKAETYAVIGRLRNLQSVLDTAIATDNA